MSGGHAVPFDWSYQTPEGRPGFKRSLFGAVKAAKAVQASREALGLDSYVILTHRPTGRTWRILPDTDPFKIEVEYKAPDRRCESCPHRTENRARVYLAHGEFPQTGATIDLNWKGEAHCCHEALPARTPCRGADRQDLDEV